MGDNIDHMTDQQRDALAKIALENARKARERAKEFRDRRKSKGMVQISVWVPADEAKKLKSGLEAHVKKIMSEKNAKKDMSGRQS